MKFDGVQTGNLLLTNALANFDANPGFTLALTPNQAGSVTIVESNTAATRIRFNQGNTITLSNGAGSLSLGNGSSTLLQVALGVGNGAVHNVTNLSTTGSTVTFNSETYFIMGGGGSHTLAFYGPGNSYVNSSWQSFNNANLNLTVGGPGTVTVVGTAPLAGYAGTYGNVAVNGGTLAVAGAKALGSGNTVTLNNGGSLDCVVANLTNSTANAMSWNGNWTFVGTQNFDTGTGTVTNTGSRIVTVNANTLSVSGPIYGSTASVTKAGAGTLVFNNYGFYTGGTVVSNGLLLLNNAYAFPNPTMLGAVGATATAATEGLAVYGSGKVDVFGNSITVSSLNGGGIVDTTAAGGSPMLTVGDYNTNGVFTGSIQNTAGTMSLTKIGNGTLVLGGASTYNGGTTVSGGTLFVTNTTGSGTGSGPVTVGSGTTFGGSGSVAGSVDWQAGSSALFGVNSVGGANTTPFTVSGSVTLNGNPVTVNVAGVIPLDPGTYTLMTYNTSGSSGAFATSGVNYTGAGVSPGTVSSISTSGGTVKLTVVSLITGVHSTWTNNASGSWSVGANWSSNPNIPHAAGDLATLGSGAGYTAVTLDANESVGGVVFTNANSFNIADAGETLTFDNSGNGALISVANGSSNAIGTAVFLNDNLSVSLYPSTAVVLTNTVSSSSAKMITANGLGTVTLSANNTYGPSAGSVGTILSAGATAQLGNNGALGAGDVVVTNGSELVRALTGLTVANNFSLDGSPMTFDNNGNNVTLSGVISGAGALGKNGAGTLTLTGANTYNGDTSISAGTVKLGNASAIPGGTGNGNVNMGTNTTLDLNGLSPILNGLNASFGSATVDSLSGGAVTLTLGESGAYATYYGSIKNTSGSLALVKDGAGNQTLAGTNTYTGGTTINAGLVRVGNGNTNTSGSLIAVGLGSGPVVDNATLEFNLVGTNMFTNAISGSGAVNVANSSLNLFLSPANTFSGSVNVNGGSLWITNVGSLGTGPKTVYAVAGGSSSKTDIHLAGNITIPAAFSFQLTYLNGVLFNESGNNTVQGDITLPYGGGATYIIVSNGFLTLSGNVASDGIANGRNFQLGGPGNGLFSGVASDNAQTLGALTKVDSGTWTVSGASTTVAGMNINAGTLVLSGQWAGVVTVSSNATLTGTGTALTNLTVNSPAKFVPGAYGSIGTFTVVSNFTLAGSMYASVNKSAGQPNTVVNVGNATANSGSTLIVSNLGPALVGGERFQLFTQPVTNGNLVTIVPPTGVTFTNNLAVDGSITALSPMATNPTNITYSFKAGQLTLSWPGDHQGWLLQSQTNNVGSGLTMTNWHDVIGTDASTNAVITVDSSHGSVFFRLRKP
jgi:autotransporter-associated beta strand protein